MDIKHPYLHNAAYKMFADTVLMALRKNILSPDQIDDAVLFAKQRYAKERLGIIPTDDDRLHASLLGFHDDGQKLVKNGTSVVKAENGKDAVNGDDT